MAYLASKDYHVTSKIAAEVKGKLEAAGIGGGGTKTPTKPDTSKIPTKPSGGTGVTIKDAIDFANDALIHDRIANITMQGVIKYLKDHNKYPSLSLAEERSFYGMIRTLARNAAEKKAKSSLEKE